VTGKGGGRSVERLKFLGGWEGGENIEFCTTKL